MSAQDPPVVQLEKVNFAYNKAPVLRDVSLRITGPQFASVVGPNGGGKTTLLKLMLGMLKPDRGSIHVFGESPETVRDRIGYTPQHMHFDPKFPIGVMDVVLMGRLGQTPGGRYTKDDRQAAEEALDQMNLEDIGRKLFSDLSGGQRQRVLIARSLACRPQLLLLDEPTANIDAAVEKRLLEILKNLSKNIPVIMVSHDLGFVSDIVDTVICVNRKVVVHPTSEITGEIIRDIYGTDIRMVRHDHSCSEKGHETMNIS